MASSAARAAGAEAGEELNYFVTSNYERNFELEALLPGAETLDIIREYELQVAAMTLLDVENVAAGEPIYEDEVETILGQVLSLQPTSEVIPTPETPFSETDYPGQLREIIAAIEDLNTDDNPELYEDLTKSVNETLDLLETQIPGHPEAVQLLRAFVRLGVFVRLLQGPGMGVLLEPHTTELFEGLREILLGGTRSGAVTRL